MKYYMGIDPGYASGAICLLREDLKEILFYDIIDSSSKVTRWQTPLIKTFKTFKDRIEYAAIESVNPSFNQGIVSAGHFKGAAMVLETLIELLECPFEKVIPVKWQESLGISVEKEALYVEDMPEAREKKRQTNKKNLKKSIFAWGKATYPQAELRSFTKDTNRADALGIAHYAKLKVSKK